MSADVVRLPTLHERRQKRLRFALIDTWAEFRTEGYSADEIAEALEAQAKLLRQCAEHWRQIDRALDLDGVPEPEKTGPKVSGNDCRKAAAPVPDSDAPLLSYRNANSEGASKSEQVREASQGTRSDLDNTSPHNEGKSQASVERLRAINRAPEADGGES